NESFAETVAAFANGDGGIVLIGVSDEAEVIGFDRPKLRDQIVDIVRGFVRDPVAVTPEMALIRGKRVWVVTVPAQRPEAKPFRCGDRVMVRASGTTRVASTAEHRALVGPR